MIAFACAKYRNDLILADFNLAAGWLIRQTAKFNFPAIQYHKNFEEMSPFLLRFMAARYFKFGGEIIQLLIVALTQNQFSLAHYAWFIIPCACARGTIRLSVLAMGSATT